MHDFSIEVTLSATDTNKRNANLRNRIIGTGLEWYNLELESATPPSPKSIRDLFEVPSSSASEPTRIELDPKRVPAYTLLHTGNALAGVAACRLAYNLYKLERRNPGIIPARLPRAFGTMVLCAYMSTFTIGCLARIEGGRSFQLSGLWHPIESFRNGLGRFVVELF